MSGQTLLGFAVLAASLGPGYVFERIAEQKRPPTPRSALGETVELVVTGAVFTIFAAMVVLTVGKATSWLDVGQLAKHADAYLVSHPGRGLSGLAALYALSFASAGISAALIYRNAGAQINPGGTPWHHVFLTSRPSKDAAAFVTVCLRDGREVGGALASYSLTGENREIALARPIAVRAAGADKPEPLNQDFVLLREADVAEVRVHHVPAG